MEKIILTPQQIADEMGMARKTFLQKIATDPTFPPRITINSKTFYWFRDDVVKWWEGKKESRPSI
ncbi:helix-turn-helix transcriptional regulator [Wielerella bovis]|uniref:helix-turn-helix transcriptional regulator n=1 Tax=Wielerella bovis TaxID=2917790 RepID=UPI00201943F5|nr:hypothetical protein [Wielerella bovis]ULJ66215.1 hypothetical protein MIS31_08015 [Wielerella bovis]